MPTTNDIVGFVGIGAMGTPMAGNLARAGYPLVVFDLDATRTAALAREHAVTVAASLAEVGAAANILITMLPDGKAVRTALCGDSDSFRDCVLERAPQQALVIDMSSSSPLGTRELGRLLAARGTPFIDAPVSGGVKGAVAASLAIMVGGDKAIFERVRPLLAKMGSQLFHAGPLGSGHAIKALNNYVSAAGLVAACEAIIAAERFGLDPAVATDIINASSGMNNTTKNKVKQQMLNGAFGAGFATALMAKDVRTALEVVASTGTPADLARHCAAFWTAAADDLPAGADHTAVFKLLAGRNPG
ncbi:MAG: NAD(P)-dependent oxidoreductase [Betaproteobacteria bacterium]|nr:MAG: NAD(P)-dependent oxidoreductase [Betaproteobacteria bacterium]